MPRRNTPQSVRSAHPKAGDAFRALAQSVVDLEHALSDTTVTQAEAEASCGQLAIRITLEASRIAYELRYPWQPRS